MMSSSQRSIPTVDRISDLPDSILCHILSFFPTIFAATTSVLSKRWKSVWLSVLALDFDHEAFNDFESFNKFVYLTMFSLRDKKTSIHSFTLKCGESSRFNQTQLNRIFKFVMERGVENLNFDMSHKKRQIKLPLCILSFKTLEVLKLSNTIIGDFDQIGFPLLKTLYLNKVSFISHENIVKFLSGCPILEDLEIEKMLLTHQTRLPVFHNLTSLKLSMHLTFWPGECSSLLGMLQHFPKLQHFNIQDNAPSDDISCKCWKDPPTTAPECLSSQLKTCYISGYKGTECYFKFAKYILQHSNVLEIMRIKTTFGAKNQMLLRKLSSVTKGSPTCKLLFD